MKNKKLKIRIPLPKKSTIIMKNKKRYERKQKHKKRLINLI
jgi:hypothetical protein